MTDRFLEIALRAALAGGEAAGPTSTRQAPAAGMRRRAAAPCEPIQARTPAPDGIVVVHSRSHENSRRLAEYFQNRAVLRRMVRGSALKFGIVAAGDADFSPPLRTPQGVETPPHPALPRTARGPVP